MLMSLNAAVRLWDPFLFKHQVWNSFARHLLIVGRPMFQIFRSCSFTLYNKNKVTDSDPEVIHRVCLQIKNTFNWMTFQACGAWFVLWLLSPGVIFYSFLHRFNCLSYDLALWTGSIQVPCFVGETACVYESSGCRNQRFVKVNPVLNLPASLTTLKTTPQFFNCLRKIKLSPSVKISALTDISSLLYYILF